MTYDIFGNSYCILGCAYRQGLSGLEGDQFRSDCLCSL